MPTDPFIREAAAAAGTKLSRPEILVANPITPDTPVRRHSAPLGGGIRHATERRPAHLAKNNKIETPVIAVIDERALRESDRKLSDLGNRSSRTLADKLANAGTDGGKLMSQNLERSFKISPAPFNRLTADASRAGVTAGDNLRQGIQRGMAQAISSQTASFGAFGNAADSALNGIIGKGRVAGLAVAGVGVAAVAAAKQIYDLGNEWDNVIDGSAGKTGKLGSELESLTNSTKRVASTTATPIADLANIVAAVSQATKHTGTDLDSLSANVANFQRVTGQGVDVRQLGKLYQLFDVRDVDTQTAALDRLAQASWATGAPVNSLIDATQRAGRAARQMGLDLGATAGLIVTLEQAGLDFSKVETGLAVSLKNFANAGREPAEALRETITQIKALSDAGRDSQAIALSSQTFGKGYLDLFNAIKDGRLDVDGLNESLKGNGNTIQDLANETADFSEQWQIFTNKLKSTFEPVASNFFTFLNTQMTGALDGVTGIAKGFEGLGFAWGQLTDFIAGNPLQPQAITGATVLGPDGKLMPVAGPAPGANPFAGQGAGPGAGQGTTLDQYLGLAPPPNTPPLPLPGIRPNPWGTVGGQTYKQWYQNDDSTTGGGSSTQTGPQVPYPTTDPTSLIQPGQPVTSAAYGAAQSVIEAGHKVAQENAELQALIASTTATAEQVQKARNEVVEAEQAEGPRISAGTATASRPRSAPRPWFPAAGSGRWLPPRRPKTAVRWSKTSGALRARPRPRWSVPRPAMRSGSTEMPTRSSVGQGYLSIRRARRSR